MSDIDLTGRPVKGNMICKKVKSKPYHIHTIMTLEMHEEIVICAQDIQKLLMKDVTLMSKEATFSTPVPSAKDFFFISKMKKVETVEMPKMEEKQAEFEELNFDLE